MATRWPDGFANAHWPLTQAYLHPWGGVFPVRLPTDLVGVSCLKTATHRTSHSADAHVPGDLEFLHGVWMAGSVGLEGCKLQMSFLNKKMGNFPLPWLSEKGYLWMNLLEIRVWMLETESLKVWMLVSDTLIEASVHLTLIRISLISLRKAQRQICFIYSVGNALIRYSYSILLTSPWQPWIPSVSFV